MYGALFAPAQPRSTVLVMRLREIKPSMRRRMHDLIFSKCPEL